MKENLSDLSAIEKNDVTTEKIHEKDEIVDENHEENLDGGILTKKIVESDLNGVENSLNVKENLEQIDVDEKEVRSIKSISNNKDYALDLSFENPDEPKDYLLASTCRAGNYFFILS